MLITKNKFTRVTIQDLFSQLFFSCHCEFVKEGKGRNFILLSWLCTTGTELGDCYYCCCSIAQSCPTLCDCLWSAARLAFLSITNSQSLLKLMSCELVMPSNHLILCHTLFLLPSIFPNIFSNESAVYIRRPKYWSFSFSLRPSNLFRVDFL